MQNYGIKENYVANPPGMHVVGTTPEISEYQPDIYSLAINLANKGEKKIIDIGCGRAWKLREAISIMKVLGVDTETTIEWCRNKYPKGNWQPINLEKVIPTDISQEWIRKSVMICADVIEHMRDPSNLVKSIKEWLREASCCILSTPERDREYGESHVGPPGNRMHVREWNILELKRYLISMNLNVGFIGLTKTHQKLEGLQAYRTIITLLI